VKISEIAGFTTPRNSNHQRELTRVGHNIAEQPALEAFAVSLGTAISSKELLHQPSDLLLEERQ
jgi:hypothetical protein